MNAIKQEWMVQSLSILGFLKAISIFFSSSIQKVVMNGGYPKWKPYSMTDEDKVWDRNLVWIKCIHPYLNETPDGLKVKTKMGRILYVHPYLIENLDGLKVKT